MARALAPAVSRPISTLFRGHDKDAVKESGYAGGTACATTTSPAFSEVGWAVPPASPACGRLFHTSQSAVAEASARVPGPRGTPAGGTGRAKSSHTHSHEKGRLHSEPDTQPRGLPHGLARRQGGFSRPRSSETKTGRGRHQCPPRPVQQSEGSAPGADLLRCLGGQAAAGGLGFLRGLALLGG